MTGAVFFAFMVLLSFFEAVADEVLDFSSIKSVIEKDNLDAELARQQKKERESIERKKRAQIKTYQVPPEGELLSFLSRYWLVKNASLLKWDFKRPDYGVAPVLTEFFQKQGIYEKDIFILYIETPNIYHFSLPSSERELIVLLSKPFLEILDLSKLEIAVLVYAEYRRAQLGFFSSKLKREVKVVERFSGRNLKGISSDLGKELLAPALAFYDKILLEEGMNLDEQFKLTQAVGRHLQSDPKLFQTYLDIIKKIAALIKSNILYQNYSKLFPSPELQVQWLSPDQKENL